MHDEYWNKYWEFSIDDLANDLIENIDVVRQITDKDKVSFVGHGHGATQMFMCMYNFQSEVEKRISSCIALAPIAHNQYTKNAFYEFYQKYWRGFKGSVNYELWGRGYNDRVSNSNKETTFELE